MNRKRSGDYAGYGSVPTLEDAEGSSSVEAWFMGPRGENGDIVERLVVEAVRDHIYWRRNYHPSDPSCISADKRLSDEEFAKTIGALEDGYNLLLSFLKKSAPFFSMRYQGHMNWDLTIPGILGYFAAMLYNPNNVAYQGSTATTLLEMVVGDDLCRMFGYEICEVLGETHPRPWGHITCDGTVANIEAIWSARNLKYLPLAFQRALKAKRLENAASIKVNTCDGQELELVNLDDWQLLNIRSDDALDLTERIMKSYDIKPADVTEAIKPYLLQNLGFVGMASKMVWSNDPLFAQPVFTVPGTKHYSFPKAAAVLGMGVQQMHDVPVDLDARQDVAKLESFLNKCLEEKRPVICVVAVMGSTEESAIDPLKNIIELRETFRKKGLDFTVHADAAWGGYHISVIRDDYPKRPPPQPSTKAVLSNYVTQQLNELRNADSITVDPHKSGFIPYPAGALCYRNSAMRDLVRFSAPVIFREETKPTGDIYEPNVGIYGIEGSKPGAAAASVYLSHRVIRPSKSGYGQIIGRALLSCKKLYARLLCMDTYRRDGQKMTGQHLPYRVVPVPRLPAEREGKNDTTIKKQIEFIRKYIDEPSGTQGSIIQRKADELLREIGPDENILCYAFNYKLKSGEWNKCLTAANSFNQKLYDKLSIQPVTDISRYDLIVSMTKLDSEQYGDDFIRSYRGRLLDSEIETRLRSR